MSERRLDHFRGGTGEPLVLLHGLLASWHHWSPILDRLTAERDVLAPTHLGHHGSPAFEDGRPPTIAGWTDAAESELDAAGLDQPDFAGHSLGGWIAMELAKRGRARSVVAISPAGRYSDEEIRRIARLERRYHRMARWFLPLGRRVVRTSVGRRALLADGIADPRRARPEDAERIVVDIARCTDAEGLIGALMDDRRRAIRFENGERVQCSVLIALPERDRFFTRSHAERFAEALPDATIAVLPDCGHNAMFDHPELVSSSILSFSSTTSTQP
jgi:pimeloyl-ACP methyl ester carboxylesterase